MPINQGLMKRNPNLTSQQFSETWCKEHGAIIDPYFVHSGVTYYAQVFFFVFPTRSLAVLCLTHS